MSERRKYKRFAVECSATLAAQDAAAPEAARCMNVSDGGALFSVPVEWTPDPGIQVHVRFALPRSTPNTYMVEGVYASARVVRVERLPDDAHVAVAVRFAKPLALDLEV